MTDRLFKLHGSGNDFLLGIGAWSDRLAGEPELVARLCHRRLGIGADGVLAVRAVGPNRLEVVYRNGDGGRAALCANGLRCAARVAVELLGLPTQLELVTDVGGIAAKVEGAVVAVDLAPPSVAPAVRRLQVGHLTWEGWFTVIGVPHLVVMVPDGLAALDLSSVAPPLRRHPELGPEGANVSFVEVAAADRLSIRSWERGVEGETLSCGTGVVAAAVVHLAEHRRRRVVCRVASGDVLVVEALGDPPLCVTRLTGPTVMVGEILPTPELLGE